MFQKMKAKAEQRRQQREFESAQVAHRRWEEQVTDAEDTLGLARTFEPLDPATVDSPLVPKKGEMLYMVGEGAGLAEPRRLPGQWVGGHRGVSVRVAKGVYLRGGGSRGTYAQGAEQQQMIDQGTFVITNQRVVFLGAKYTREWAYSKLLGLQHDDDLGATYMQVSNRQKVSGIVYGSQAADDVRFRLGLALSVFGDERDDFVGDLEQQVADLKRERPALPPPPPAPE
jgi:hypothetical protein